jgi:flagellar biosynthesis/type III secretory pathway chaperone
MIDDLIDIIDSLTLIMEEETAALDGSGRHPQQRELVDAKLRLVAALEVRVSQIARGDIDWQGNLDETTRALLLQTLARLRDAAEPNARLLSRQIDLSTEMMGVVANEAIRLAGKRGVTYGAGGGLARTNVSTPISINTSL